MNDNQVHILTIYSEDSIGRDIRKLLDIVHYELHKEVKWWIERLDCTGREAQDICNQANQPGGMIIRSDELQDVAEKFDQVFDGIFVCFQDNILEVDKSLIQFKVASSLLAVEVIEDTHIDTYIRSEKIKLKIMQEFNRVSENNLQDYFPS